MRFFILLLLVIISINPVFTQNNKFKPTADFSLDSVKYNGFKWNWDNYIQFHKYKNCVSSENCINDTSLAGWYTAEEFKKKGDSTKPYLMAQEITIPKNLFDIPLFRSVSPDIEKIWQNGKLVYDFTIEDNKKLNENLIGIEYPFSFSKEKNIIIHQVNNSNKNIWNYFGQRLVSYINYINYIYNNHNSNIILGTLSSFLFAVSLMLLFIYLFGIREKKYLWGTLFTLSLSIVLFWSTGYISTNYDVFGTILIFLSTITPYFLVEFIYSLFDFTIPKWIKKILFFGCLLIVLILILEILEVDLYQDWFWIFFTTLIIFLFTISSIFVFIGIYKAVKQRLFNAKVLLIGLTLIILLTIFWLFDNLLGNGNISVTNWYRVLHILPLPICVLIAIVRDYVASNKNLKKQLIKVEELTAQTIKEQEEKQQILASQNEKLEQQVTERTSEINAQKNLLQEKQKEILDSIHYAKRLQEAILPPLTFIDEHVPKNFVLYQPKDVVAGDFYWAETKDNKFFIAAADCTGHGVPGAMVSVVCSNALNRTVNEFGITDTGKILDKTRELVLETFAKGNAEVKDGMDISLLCIDKQNNKAFWSGANNPLWYVKLSGTEALEVPVITVTSSEVEMSTDAGLDSARPYIQLIEIKADKQPIGKTDHAKPFTTNEIALQEGMLFYLFTDGYADQFGGPKGKKFKYKQLEELLLTNATKTMNEQHEILTQQFALWKGDLEQVDDVCVIGVRV